MGTEQKSDLSATNEKSVSVTMIVDDWVTEEKDINSIYIGRPDIF